MNKKRLLLFLWCLSAAFSALADEGMWLPSLIGRQVDDMKAKGFRLTAEDIYSVNQASLKDAVVLFGRGCTGELVSPEGLLLTNHHCGYGQIQSHSSLQHDYLTDGFWAMSREEELPNPGLTVSFLVRMEDVTDRVLAGVKDDMDETRRQKKIAANIERVKERALKEYKGQKGYEVSVESLYYGNQYFLFLFRTYGDVRLVGAPPSAIGKFGGETDNWMWPRHTGDFSIFPIYADKDGRPAAYSADNMPLRVKKHLNISLRGYKEGDFAFVMGFPGRNWRYMIADEVEERMQTTNFMRHHVRDARQRVLMEQMLKDDAVRIHYASKYASSANYWKNAIGMNEGLVRLHVLDTKRAQQEALLQRGRELGDTTYQAAFDRIRAIVQKRRPALYHQQAIQEALVTALDFMRIPNTTALATALKSKDKAAIQAATDTLRQAADRYFASVPYPEVEKLVGKEMLRTYAKYIPADQRIGIFKVIDKRFKGDTDAFIDACFEYSIFGSRENFDKFISKPKLYKLTGDWMVLFKYSITDGLLQTAIAMMDANRDYNAAHKTWVKGMMDLRQANGQPIYPDANSTLRLTYGKVASYEPADGVVYDYYTTLDGVMQKEDPTNWEFVVPDKLKQLWQAKDFGRYALEDGRMPVCFIVDTDNTGGNSGSPVFNAKGELIGTGFDRNYEGLTGDIAFRPSSQRAACVDIRYTLFIIEKYAGAKHLIDELSIVE